VSEKKQDIARRGFPASIKEFAALTGTPEETLWRLARKGKIPTLRLG
jgi:hypothetical protein